MNNDRTIFSEFQINCGVKQGGILSPYLFNCFIDDLICEITNRNVGALYKNLNTSIVVYADDILLISPVGRHLQIMLDICSKYSSDWLIKFNPSKSKIITFGEPTVPNQEFKIQNLIIEGTDKIEYLGIEINNKFDFDTPAREKFKKVEKSIFSLSYLGLTPTGVSPELKSFLYKTYCLSQFTYGLETTTLTPETLKILNIAQNNLVRQIIGLQRNCHMTDILNAIKILDINSLYLKSKLSFVNTIKNNELCLGIFNHICRELGSKEGKSEQAKQDIKKFEVENGKKTDSSKVIKKYIAQKSKLFIENVLKKSKSFEKDIFSLQNYFGMDIELMFAGPARLKYVFKETFNEENGTTDSIKYLLKDYKSKKAKDLLNILIRPEYFQEYINLMHAIIDT